MIFQEMVISFAFFSFIGWAYESFICSIVNEKRFINRGFLISPLCPVYGVGAIVCYMAFSSIDNLLLLFSASAIMCSVIEYVTGYLLEEIFHNKWWDYSKYPFQIHGRICLYGAIIFGICNIVVCTLVEPLLIYYIGLINGNIKILITIGIGLLIIIDLSLTIIGNIENGKNTSNAYYRMNAISNNRMEWLSTKVMEYMPTRIMNGQAKIQNKTKYINNNLKNREAALLSLIW